MTNPLGIKRFDKNNIDSVRDIVEKKIKELEAETGMTFSTGSITYGGFELTLQCKVDLNPNGMPAKEMSFLTNCMSEGLKPEDLGSTFIDGRSRYKIIGHKINTRYNIICERTDGKEYSFKGRYIAELLGR